jgi:RimJ/RimL family protein N-acetyltransferase
MGFATRAIQEATKLAKFRGNQSVSIGTHIANFPMRRVIEKSGFHILDKPRFVTARNSIHFIKDLL